jgi:hypothetical protein
MAQLIEERIRGTLRGTGSDPAARSFPYNPFDSYLAA